MAKHNIGRKPGSFARQGCLTPLLSLEWETKIVSAGMVNNLARLSESERATLLKNAINSASDLSILSDVVRSIAGDLNPEGAKDRRAIAGLGEEANEVRDLLIQRIRDLAETNRIWSQANPGHLLWFWWGADKASEVFKFTDQTMKTEEGLNGLLDASVSTVISSAGNYERVSQSWSKIVNISELTERALQSSNKPEGDEQKRLALRFLAATKKEQESPF